MNETLLLQGPVPHRPHVDDGLRAAVPALELPAPNGPKFPTEGGSRGLGWDPRCPRPCSKA